MRDAYSNVKCIDVCVLPHSCGTTRSWHSCGMTRSCLRTPIHMWNTWCMCFSCMCQESLRCDISHSFVECFMYVLFMCYGVATISRMLKNIGLFCKRDLQKRPIFCKETYIFKHPTHRSHPIVMCYSCVRRDSFLHSISHEYVKYFIHVLFMYESCLVHM